MLADRTKLLSVSELASRVRPDFAGSALLPNARAAQSEAAGGTRVYDYHDHARLTALWRIRIELDDTIRELEDMKQDALARLKASERSTGS